MKVLKNYMLFFSVLAAFFFCLHGNGASLSEPMKNVQWEAGFVLDFFYNKEVDNIFPHYAVDGDSVFEATPKESYLTFEIDMGHRGGYQLKSGGEFNFMGPEGFQIFSAWLTLDRNSHYLTVGKISSLAGTDEMSLNYEAFNSTGTIRTGVKDNQHQIEFGVRSATWATIVVAASDEKADLGGVEEIGMTSDRPTFQAAFLFSFEYVEGKVALSDTKMKLDNGDTFDPEVLMAEVDILFNDCLKLKLAGFDGQGGSQFFTQDNIFDYYYDNENIVEVEHTGVFAELIYESENTTAWIGGGSFSTDDASVDHFRNAEADMFMVSNDRVSIGIQYEWLKDIFVGVEVSRYKTSTVQSGLDNSSTGHSMQLQFKWIFSNR